MRADYVTMIQRSKLDLRDNYWYEQSRHEDIGFTINKELTRNMPYPNTFQNAITFELSLDQESYYRTVYSFLDYLSELGGLFSALGRICLVIATSLNYFGSFQFVMADNFFYRSGQVYKNDV